MNRKTACSGTARDTNGSEFLDNMIRGGHRKLARSFNLCYRYIDDLVVSTIRSLGIMSKRFNPRN